MWISAAVVFLAVFVLLEPAEEVEAGRSRLVIHTPQQVKVIHKYRTTVHYAKDYGYGYNNRHKPMKPGRGKKGRRPLRGRYRKRYIRKVGKRVPFRDGKSYGMNNYAKNYRNWTPQKRYRGSYSSIRDGQAYESQEHVGNHADSDYNEDEGSVADSTPFGNEIEAIDYYAARNRNHDRHDRRRSNIRTRGSKHDYVGPNSYQADKAAVESRVTGYSTLPDEIINNHSSSGGHDFLYTSAADEGFQAFQNHNTGHGQEFRFSDQNFGDGGDLWVKNQKSGNRQELLLNVQNFPAVRGTQFGGHNLGSGQRPAGRDDLGFNSHTFGGTRELQYNRQISQTGQESRLRNQNSGGQHDLRYNTQNSAGRFNNQNSASEVHSSEPGFAVSHGNTNNNRPHRETEHNFGETATSHPTSEDLYYKAFRSFSFRKNPPYSNSKGQFGSSSDAGFNNKHVPVSSSPSHQSGIAHTDRGSNQWFNGRTGPNKDHDIGFFEGLEDINDRVGI